MIMNQVVAGSGGGSSVAEPYINWEVQNGELVSTANHVMDFTGVTELNVGFYRAYYGNQNIGAVDMSSITKLSGPTQFCSYMFAGSSITSLDLSGLTAFSQGAFYYACYNCTQLTTIDLSGMTTAGSSSEIFRYAFINCTALTTVKLQNLESVGVSSVFGYAFQNCTALTAINLKKLKSVTGNYSFQQAFQNTGLITVSFESLDTITGSAMFSSAFADCVNMESVWFYALNSASFGSNTSQFNNLINNCTNVTVHFPIAIQSTIGSWTSVTGGFGGTNTTVLFDIVTSLTGADSNTYTRSEKNSTPTATAWSYNDTLYYTSGGSNHTAGVNEPSVGDTIYSDAACTTAVTTISAIA